MLMHSNWIKLIELKKNNDSVLGLFECDVYVKMIILVFFCLSNQNWKTVENMGFTWQRC